MPFKHQSRSYRNRDGIKYECYSDYCESDHREKARGVVKSLRARGRKAFSIHQQGFSRVFREVDSCEFIYPENMSTCSLPKSSHKSHNSSAIVGDHAFVLY
jgi:hypothetical protein